MTAGESSDGPPACARPPEGIGPGAVILVVGPSGAGKDALLAGIRTAADPALHFVERVISRPGHAAEAHASQSSEAMAAAAAEGAFALSWEAHGLVYGIPAAIDAEVSAGKSVIFNASRTVIAAARRRYRHVFVVLVDAPEGIRAARIASRGRESSDEIEQRLRRQVAGFDRDSADYTVDNSTDLTAGVERLRTTVAEILGRIGNVE